MEQQVAFFLKDTKAQFDWEKILSVKFNLHHDQLEHG